MPLCARGLGEVYKRQGLVLCKRRSFFARHPHLFGRMADGYNQNVWRFHADRHPDACLHEIAKHFDCSRPPCLLYLSHAADEEQSVDVGGRRPNNKEHILIFTYDTWHDSGHECGG
ncbi:hypothetical protein C5B34_13170, partial [Neisseria gonorrhoeae]